MTVPEARRDPVLRRFPLRRLRLPMAGGTLSLVVPDRTWLGDAGHAARAAAGIEPPYWADVWPASLAVARWLSRRDLTGRSCLDLGCGLGLPGAAALRAGAAVTFADREPDALAFAAFNGRIAARERIGPASADGAPTAGGAAVACVRLDWARETVPGRFDLISLCDVTYRPAHHLPVLRHLREALGDGGLVLHADPFRRESLGFLSCLEREFACVTTRVPTTLGDQRVEVRLVFAARTADVLESRLAAPRTIGSPS